MGKHAEIVGPQGNHVAHDFEYADTAAREGATGLVDGDLKKLALQLDNFSLWILTATTPTWVRLGNAAGSGDVVGPGSSTDNALPRFDGVTGQLIQDSGAILTDAGVLSIVGAINSESRKVSTNPAIIVEIFSAADLDALATAGVITVTAGTDLILRIKAAALTTANRFVLEDGATLVMDGNRLSVFNYSAALTLFTGVTSAIRLNGMIFTATGGGTLFSIVSLDASSSIVTIDRCRLIDWKLGSVTRSILVVTFSIFFDWESGLSVNSVRTFLASGILFTQLDGVAVTDSLFKINTHDPVAVINLHFSTGVLPAGDFFAKIDPGLHNNAKAIIGASIITGDLFDTSGITGAFTGVADATVAPTTINSVIDSPSSPGIARFNFTPGPTLFINQFVDVSAFVTNTAYNQSGLVSAVGAGFFEISPIAFGTTEAGSFKSDSVTLTDTGTTATDNLGVTIDTDGATNYDGGAIVYNKQTNSFDIHRVFTITHTGSWSAEGLDESDPRVITLGNPGQADSTYIASAFVNANTTAIGTIVNGVFRDMTFGTGGSALIAGSNQERWKLIDEVLGIFEYIGNEPLEGSITFDFTIDATGEQEFRFKWVIDTGSGFGNLPDNVEALASIKDTATSITKTFPLAVLKGDRIKPQVTRNAGSQGITVEYATMYLAG